MAKLKLNLESVLLLDQRMGRKIFSVRKTELKALHETWLIITTRMITLIIKLRVGTLKISFSEKLALEEGSDIIHTSPSLSKPAGRLQAFLLAAARQVVTLPLLLSLHWGKGFHPPTTKTRMTCRTVR